MPIFKFLNRATAKPDEQPGKHEGADSDSDDDIVAVPRQPTRRSLSFAEGENRNGVTNRRRAIDMSSSHDEQLPAIVPNRRRAMERQHSAPRFSSDNGLQAVPIVGRPGALLGPDRVSDLMRWRSGKDHSFLRGVLLATGRPVMAKVYERAGLIPSMEAQIQCEQKIHEKIQRLGGVMMYYATQTDAKHICLLFAQDLRPSLGPQLSRGGTLAEDVASSAVAAPLLVTLAELHMSGIIHRNVTLENVLYSESEAPCLIDLSLAVDTQQGDEQYSGLPNSRVGTLEYMAPEVVQKPTSEEVFHEVVFKGMAEEELPMYDSRVDVFSFGVLLFRVLSGDFPFKPGSDSELRAMHSEANISGLVDRWCQHLSAPVKDLLKKCLEIDPGKRPSAESLLHHPWIYPHVKRARDQHHQRKSIEEARQSIVQTLRQSLDMSGLAVVGSDSANKLAHQRRTIASSQQAKGAMDTGFTLPTHNLHKESHVVPQVLTNNTFC